MIECKRFRIELWQCPSRGFHVSVAPLEYLRKEEFRAWVKLCRRNFMSLTTTKPWRFKIIFSSYENAVLFAKNLVRQLGEAVFFDNSKRQLMLVTPKEEA
ncbi:hypothetical protein DRO69_05535 [Candidatus Bathyarchaeota archaeon]|nr:MAG: hypothetical protein DRO69_05535 [Candidatus Bathyarchaeota archaeon]